MEPTTPTVRTIFFCFGLLAIALFLANTASADLDVNGITVEVYPQEIEPGDSFSVNVTFEEPEGTADDVDVLVRIELEGVLIHNKTYSMDFEEDKNNTLTINSNEFRVYSRSSRYDDVWRGDLMDYDCRDDMDVEVSISGDDIGSESDKDQLTITPDGDEDEYTLDLRVDPEDPEIDEDITLTVRNNDGDDIKDAKVKFTWIDDNEEGMWEYNDDSEEASRTDSDGETTFNIEDDFKGEYGAYQIDAYKDGYCKDTKSLTVAKGVLTAGNSEPVSPKVGEQFKIKVTDGQDPIQGVRGWIYLGSGAYVRSTSDSNGYLYFTVNKEGSYTVFINASGYAMVEKYVIVSSLSPMTLTVQPSPSEVNTPMTIAVFSQSSQPLSGVSLTVTQPGGSKNVLTTGSDGKAAYTPTKVGSHTIAAVKDGYADTSETFNVNSGFEIQTPAASSIIYGRDFTLTLRDSTTKLPVTNAVVAGTGVPPGSSTDYMGEFKMNLPASGTYTLIVSKAGYNDKSVTVTALCILNLRVNKTTVGLQEPVGMRVYDQEKNDYVSGNIRISLPDGTSQSETVSEHTFVPPLVGEYTLSLSKTNCLGEDVTLGVEKRPLKLESEVEGDLITVRAVSEGKPASGVSLEITSPGGVSESAVSDDDGIVVINAIDEGNYTITSSDEIYAQESISVEKQAGLLEKYWWVLLALVIVALILLLILLVAVLFMRSRKKGSSSFEPGGRSRLG